VTDFPTYPSGLRLAGRRVVVVGGGQVAQRRIPGLIAAGALVDVVSPAVTPAIEGLVGSGEVTWIERNFADTDLQDAWYVIAATADHDVNRRVSEVAQALHVFCVQSDDALASSAWTPAVGRHGAVTVAVLGDRREYRDSRRTAAVRDRILEGLQTGELDAAMGERSAGVVLIGGGPGDPGLITVAGRKALMEADVVVADRLAPRELLGDLSPDVELIDVAKLPRGRSAQQAEINRIIVDRARAGKRVARYKGGDNFVFGRGYEEIEACRAAGVPVTVIPGPEQPDRSAGDRRDPGHPSRHHARVHGHLRPPASRAPGVAGGVGRGCPDAGDRRADDGGRERAGHRRGPPRARSRRRHARCGGLRRHDADGTDGALAARDSGRGPDHLGGQGAGDHRDR
jgi:uroporphyrin-III C-methyltransferase/precorrin-2 dehydrogenase/sirohydrochlorin ferrochelatase